MPANWLGSRSNIDLTREEPHSPQSPGFEPIRRSSNASACKRRIFVNVPIDASFKDDITGKPFLSYKTNKIRTSKYTLVTFLPKNIFEQFRGIANFYFLMLVVLQCFNEFKEVDVFVTAAPIIIIVCATAVKDAFEDWKRHESDDSINKSYTYVLGNWTNTNFVVPRRSMQRAVIDFFKFIQRSISRGVRSAFFALIYVVQVLSGTPQSQNRNVMATSYPTHIFAHEYISDDQLAASTNTLDGPKMHAGNPSTLSSSKDHEHADKRIKPHHQRGMQTAHDAKQKGGQQEAEPWQLDKWENVKVGDYVFLRNNDNIPADIVIVSTSEQDSLCYIETKNLDGETNLKVKRGISDLRHVRTPADCRAVRCHIDSEPPNANLYTYTGTMAIRPKDGVPDTRANRHIIPLSTSNVILRGCVVRNTQWVIGIVLYTGADTKIMLNSGATPSKRSRVDRQINPQILLNFVILAGLCLTCALISALYARSFQFEVPPFAGTTQENIEDPFWAGILTFFRCMIIFQNIIPIALYISLDVTKTFQSFMINLDEDMVDPDSGKSATPQSWNLCDDLGQIEYIFSDKTGTLTSNTMEFRRASINGIVYGVTAEPQPDSNGDIKPQESTAAREKYDKEIEAMRKLMAELFDTKYVSTKLAFVDARIVKHLQDSSQQARKIREFFTLLAICHTVLIEKPDKSDPNKIVYNAQSPDEAALVSAAKDMGFACLRRVENTVEVDVLGLARTYTILNIIEFNSDRKRMSVIARRPEGEIVLLCKGADSMIYERLSRDNDPMLIETTSGHLAMFANEGLRTLCLAYRHVPEVEYEEWASKYAAAQALIENREAECDAVAELIERDLTLMGATAIEDKLQDGVPESIATLSKAGIKIWVLTGDKMETAINIGFACNLLKRSMILIVIKSKSLDDTIMQIKEALCRFWSASGSPVDGKQYSMIIDGESLNAMCLAIGDGANDVSMIQEADIGVGISGKEGLQAVMASDYAIAQFRFLTRLLLVHGRWAYLRSAQLVLNYFYKNAAWLFILFWHQFFCAFSGGLITDFTYGMFFNTVFSLLPTIFIGSLDQDVNDRISLQVPQLYFKGIYQKLYSMEQFWRSLADALYQSIVCYFFGMLLFVDQTTHPSGWDLGIESVGTAIAVAAVILVNLYALVSWSSWTYLTHVAVWPTIVIWIAYVVAYASQQGAQYGVIRVLFTTPSFYLGVVLIIVVSLFPRIAMKFVQQYFMPTDTDIAREIQHYQWKDGMQLSLDIEVSNKDSVNSLNAVDSAQALQDKLGEPVKRNTSDLELHQIDIDRRAPAPGLERTRSEDRLKSLSKPEGASGLITSMSISGTATMGGSGLVSTGRKLVEAIVDSTGHIVPSDNVGVSTDGFGSADATRLRAAHAAVVQAGGTGSVSLHHGGSAGDHPHEGRSRRTSFSSAFKTGVNRASQFVRRIAHPLPPPSLQLARSTRASSLVYMGENGCQVANTGFAFSHDSGMITFTATNTLTLMATHTAMPTDTVTVTDTVMGTVTGTGMGMAPAISPGTPSRSTAGLKIASIRRLAAIPRATQDISIASPTADTSKIMTTIQQPHWQMPEGTPVPQLRMHNSLTRKKEPFVPEHGRRVTWYSCGPTVYDKSHLGHARNFITTDILRRILKDFFGYDVLFVMNITDIDDKVCLDLARSHLASRPALMPAANPDAAKIIINARQKHLFEKYRQEHGVLTPAVIADADNAWTFFVTKRLGKFFGEAALKWDEFLALNAEGKLNGTANDAKFGLYLKTSTVARDAIKRAKARSITIDEFYGAVQDPLSQWIDSKEGDKTTDHKIFRDFAAYWESDYFADMDALNILRPDVLTRVSEYVPEIITFVERIISNGFAYELDGSVYFDTVKFDKSEKHTYAKIEPWSAGNVKLLQEGEGDLAADASGKRNAADFALWKKSKPGEPFWDSPWGKGRPGWHIECSVMAGDVLGEKMDIHSGGVDLTFPHHDNELAQSESHYGCTQWVNYFLHGGHLHIEGQKMSKSLKNFISIKEVLAQHTAAQIRIMFLMHDWNGTLDYSIGSMSEARGIEASINNFLSLVKAVVQESRFASQSHSSTHNYGDSEKELVATLLQKQAAIYAALADSFDTPLAMQELRQLISQANQYYQNKTKAKQTPNALVLNKIGAYVTKLMRTFGVFGDANPEVGAPASGTGQNLEEAVMPYLRALSTFRDTVRELAQSKADPKEFLALCDRLRDEDLADLGVLLEDKEGGKALVKLVDRETILRQRQEKIAKEQERAREKEERLRALAQKKAERLEKGRMPPSEMFRTDEFSEWDAQGIPTKDKEGNDVAKSRRKKLEKEYAAQKKLHDEFLAETAGSA
nr:hypothetical protein HK105_000825 [Polyrhizophydium stewartii]